VPRVTNDHSPRLIRPGRPFFKGAVGAKSISAILPVKNRAHHLPGLLDRLKAQECDAELEVIAVDSGSTDGTVSVLEQYGCTVLTVPQESFDYGLTRNAAAGFSRAEFLLFISSTMLPVDRHWLQPLIERISESASMAGVYSRGIPSPNSNLLNARDYLRADLLTNRRHFPEVTRLDDPLIRVIADREAYGRLTAAERRQFISFSNVSSLVRGDVFRAHPFSKVDSCGEDMLWARTVLEAGYAVRYEPRSLVTYSHDYTDDDLFRRSFDDALGNRTIGSLGFEGEAVVPTIRSIVLDDWRYLRHARAAVADLDRQLAHAGVRRVLQVSAQWLGANWPEVGDRYGDLAEYLRNLKLPGASLELLRALIAASNFPHNGPLSLDDLIEAILNDWTPDQNETGRIEALLQHSAEFAGRWLAASVSAPDESLRARFSLIESIRRGYTTGDMTAGKIIPLPGTWPSAVKPMNWIVDVAALRGVIDLYEYEYFAAQEELEKRARVMATQNETVAVLQQHMDAAILLRDRQIRDLQRELHSKVAERDAMITNLQQEMQTKVLDCNKVIQELQRRIAAGLPDESTGESSD
jgi:rhamnosyltransferase